MRGGVVVVGCKEERGGSCAMMRMMLDEVIWVRHLCCAMLVRGSGHGDGRDGRIKMI